MEVGHRLVPSSEQGWGLLHRVISLWAPVSGSRFFSLGRELVGCGWVGGSVEVLLQVEIRMKSSFSPVNTSAFSDYRAVAGKRM